MEPIYGTVDANGGGASTLKSFKADGTLSADVTFHTFQVSPGERPYECATPLEATVTLWKTPFPGFCFAFLNCNVAVATVQGVSPLQLVAQVHADEYDEISVALGPAPQPATCSIEYVGTVAHP
jgi:hypothetical protein